MHLFGPPAANLDRETLSGRRAVVFPSGFFEVKYPGKTSIKKLKGITAMTVPAQKLGIVKSKEVLADLGVVAVGVIGIVKAGLGLRSITKLLAILDEAKDVIENAPKALPELADVDAAEAGELATVCYNLVKSVVLAVAG